METQEGRKEEKDEKEEEEEKDEERKCNCFIKEKVVI